FLPEYLGSYNPMFDGVTSFIETFTKLLKVRIELSTCDATKDGDHKHNLICCFTTT
ncbi:hypothetical protein ACJX0J_039251, partial [Zea mays]